MDGCCAPKREARASGPDRAPAPIGKKGQPFNPIQVAGGASFVGTNRPEIAIDGEGPERSVVLNDFALEAQAVTVSRFAEFVAATGHVTEAEKFGWSAVFAGLLKNGPASSPTAEGTPWWSRIDGANWRQPEGAGSSVDGRQDHPVTQISWHDAKAFAEWVGGRLPSEVEWEHAARGGSRRRKFPWGEAEPDDETVLCNIWRGQFPHENKKRDELFATMPALSFTPSESGFYNLAGNVWEWTNDAFRVRGVSRVAKARNEQARRFDDRVLKGGSFLCHKSYCYRYRIAARMGLSSDSAACNGGFRVAYDIPK